MTKHYQRGHDHIFDATSNPQRPRGWVDASHRRGNPLREWWLRPWLDPAAPRRVFWAQLAILIAILIGICLAVKIYNDQPERRYRGCALTYGMRWDYETNACVPMGGAK